MDYYYINITTKDGEVMNWDGNNFIEYNDNVDDVKQYDTMGQAEAALAMAVMTAEDTSVASLALLKDDKVVKRVYFDRDI